MSDFEWYHLLQLWKDNPHSYQHQESLEREMRSLERLQLVRFKNQLSRWERLPQGEFLLRDHVDLTDFGKCFIVWRRQFRHTTRSGDGLRCHDYLYLISLIRAHQSLQRFHVDQSRATPVDRTDVVCAVTIVWPVATKLELHTLTPLEPFGTEEEAIVEGFYLAECWVDERL